MKLVKFCSTEIPAKVRTLFRDEQARSGSKYIPILVWRINSVEQMAWLMCQGVDGGLGKNFVPYKIYVHAGVYTDEPRLLSMMAQRWALGDIVCCPPT